MHIKPVPDSAAVAIILFHVRSMMSYFRLFDWIFIIYFVIFKIENVCIYVYKS